jgi:hypothetical protein
VVNWAGSTAVFFFLAHSWNNEVVALTVAVGVPIGWTLGRFILHRKIDPVGTLTAIGYAIAVVFTLLTNGNPLAVELHDVAATGALGVACLISVVVRRPLHLLLMDLLASRHGRYQPHTDSRARRRISTVITMILGCTMVTHTAVEVILAITVPPSTFMILRYIVGLPVLGLGVAAIIWYRRRHRMRRSVEAENQSYQGAP